MKLVEIGGFGEKHPYVADTSHPLITQIVEYKNPPGYHIAIVGTSMGE